MTTFGVIWILTIMLILRGLQENFQLQSIRENELFKFRKEWKINFKRREFKQEKIEMTNKYEKKIVAFHRSNTEDSEVHRGSLSQEIQRISKATIPLHQRYNLSAPGQFGKGMSVNKALLTDKERQVYEEGYKKNGFNQFVSDQIPLDRYVGDVKNKECKMKIYRKDLPTASVVIIFYNEAWSVLWRTVHSIWNNSPPHLLKKVILVDDASVQEHLGKKLEQEVAKYPNVNLVRAKNRTGLIQARNLGFSQVQTDVAIFLDSHCECAEGWLEPLLERIADDYRNVPIPLTDTIDCDTFEYRGSKLEYMSLGGFDFDLNYAWRPVPEREQKRRGSLTAPIRTPTHLGCCFAISRRFFNELGRYDPELKIWGGENMELSFKTWMCGGKMEIIPCSQIGHLFRFVMPYSWGKDGYGNMIRNALRVAEVWMDDYKKIYYDRIFYSQNNVNIGDISERKAIRERLQCKSFDWYIKHVYPEVYVPYGCKATGQVKINNICIDSYTSGNFFGKPVSVKGCVPVGMSQHWTLTRENTIRRDEGCLVYNGINSVLVGPCTTLSKYLQWEYTQENVIKSYINNACMELDEINGIVVVRNCSQSPLQKWTWERRTINLT
ncbi:polypeptide N-acetylgalactosaminyltransferase 5-like [Saccostrea echinata]|uniref:polypeptide N-acetylgalactosaminyltransferase 5-like n=1 Tax=Saccostrea echinata TaxID=191078 RepID=UPI002A8395CA|nr:polypeptide N-acetylgalactosaminyltransferase 5-like [Saccostrea echinata]